MATALDTVRRRDSSETDTEQSQYLIFSLGGEAFAIDILHIKEIIEYGGLTEVPMMPPVVRGVINLRGAAVPVVDLSMRFGRDVTATGRRTCIIIVEVEKEGETHVVGVMVDAVNEVVEIPAADIEAPPSFGARIRSDLIAGMGKLNGAFVILLNTTQVFSSEELAAVTVGGADVPALDAPPVTVSSAAPLVAA